MPVKMHPIEPVAGDAILVGDPRRAFALAQELTIQPKMSHQARGLWGYKGLTDDGLGLSIQSTGVGGPSAVPVIGDLASQGVSRMIRLGTCLATEPGLAAGTMILVERAVAADGTARVLGAGQDFVRPDPRLLAALDGLGRQATISSHDLVLRYEPDGPGRPDSGPAIARDLQTAATFAMCRRLKIPAAALLIVAEDQAGNRVEEEPLWDMFRMAGKAVISRLAKLEPNPQVEV